MSVDDIRSNIIMVNGREVGLASTLELVGEDLVASQIKARHVRVVVGSAVTYKFSGITKGPAANWLADCGTLGTGAGVLSNPIEYPILNPTTIKSLATYMFDELFIADQTVTFRLMKNGVAVPGFTFAYAGIGATGVKSVVPAAPAVFYPGDRLALQVQTTGTQPVIAWSVTASIDGAQGLP